MFQIYNRITDVSSFKNLIKSLLRFHRTVWSYELRTNFGPSIGTLAISQHLYRLSQKLTLTRNLISNLTDFVCSRTKTMLCPCSRSGNVTHLLRLLLLSRCGKLELVPKVLSVLLSMFTYSCLFMNSTLWNDFVVDIDRALKYFLNIAH